LKNELRRISVVGLGKLGAPLAACFAWRGFPTIGVDVDARKIQTLNQGIAPIYEPRLQDLLNTCQERLTATEDYEKAVMNSDVTFIVTPTPSDNHGGFSPRYVLEAAERIGDALRQKPAYHLVVLTATVMPGTTQGELKTQLEMCSGKKCSSDFGLCYSPEFIALGSVIHDFLNPDFILIGESDPCAGQMLSDLYKSVCVNDPPVARMNFVNAELTKLAVNTYVTMKITFANMLARICERLQDANVDAVTSALGLDNRIGRKYLKGAIGYGGPCFPRDNIALTTLARAVGAPAKLAEATDVVNRQQVEWLATLVKSCLPELGKVGILGLAYKPESEVVEESQGLLLAQALANAGVTVVAYDPVATENAQRALNGLVTLASSMDECIQQADVVAVTTPWKEFKRITAVQLARGNPQRVLIDCWRIFKESQFDGVVQYLPLGVACRMFQHGNI
jgi:UDPglucose 6-dehydrogenase